jgi:predicted Zn-dependent protease
VFGDNPRQGYFKETLFLHPDMRFQFDFPRGWKTANQMTQVVGASPQEDAIVVLTMAGSKTPRDALSEFGTIEGVQLGSASQAPVNGLAAATAPFGAATQNATLRGWVTFVSHDNKTFRLLSYTTADRFGSYDAALRNAVTSFRRLEDPAALAVQPARVSLVRTARAMSLAEFDRAHPSSIPAAQLSLINGIEAGATIPAGTLMKRVTVRR